MRLCKNFVFAVVIISIGSLFLTGCVKNRMMQGYVYESYSLSPVNGVTIQVDDQTVITDKHGAYHLNTGEATKVKVLIQDKRFEEFNDWVVIPEAKNYRDYILDAAHPFGLKTKDIVIPPAYSYQLRMGKGETSLDFIGTVDSVTVDESLRIHGKRYNEEHQLLPVESIKIGLSGFEKDELGFWNMYDVPTDLQLRISAKEAYLIKVAYHFYQDPAFSYTRSDKSVVIDKVECVPFTVTEKATKKVIEVFLVKEGSYKGLVKHILQNDSEKKEYTMVTFTAYDVQNPIVPPEITE